MRERLLVVRFCAFRHTTGIIQTVVALVMYAVFLAAFVCFTLWMIADTISPNVENEYFWDAGVLALAGGGLGVLSNKLKHRSHHSVIRTRRSPRETAC
jgi:hypothetical protein